MTKEQIIGQLENTIKELGYAQMYVEQLTAAIKADDIAKAKETINNELEDYQFRTSFHAQIYGVGVDFLPDEIQNYFEELQYAAEEITTSSPVSR
jgi:hypothetical protein